jgi:hypothetical protein
MTTRTSGASIRRARTMTAVLAVLASAPALAQTQLPPPEPVQPRPPVGRSEQRGAVDRSLEGHVFTPSLNVRSPFAVTAFQADLLYGTADATGPTYDVDGNVTGSRTYTAAAMGQAFSYEKKLLEGVSVGLGAITELDSGIDGPSAVVVGAEISFGAFGRATAGHRFGPVQVAATFDASYAPRLGLQIIEAVKVALEDRVLNSGAAFNQSNVLTLKPGVAAAWSPFKALGITANVDWQWASLDSTRDSRQEETGTDFGIAADLDFGTFTSVPVALLGSYRVTAPVGGNGVDRITVGSGGLFYTGRPALVLGLEVGRRDFTFRNLDASSTIANIRFQYLW